VNWRKHLLRSMDDVDMRTRRARAEYRHARLLGEVGPDFTLPPLAVAAIVEEAVERYAVAKKAADRAWLDSPDPVSLLFDEENDAE
jgi:hypothetical protein